MTIHGIGCIPIPVSRVCDCDTYIILSRSFSNWRMFASDLQVACKKNTRAYNLLWWRSTASYELD